MKKAFGILTALACFAFGDRAYLNQNAKVLINGKDVGFVSVLSPVEVLDKNDKIANVKISGFISENYQEKLVKDPLKYEEYVVFSTDGENASFKGDINPYVKNSGKTEDEYGEIWLKSQIEFDVPTSALISDPSVIYEQAKSLYEQTCSACHHLHATTEFSVSQWPSAIESMQSSGFVVLEPEQRELIIKYLQHNAKDSK